jgi:hypothetical protein
VFLTGQIQQLAIGLSFFYLPAVLKKCAEGWGQEVVVPETTVNVHLTLSNENLTEPKTDIIYNIIVNEIDGI